MIKVIIEREIAEGLESHYEKAVGELLSVMTNAPGYISGESLVDAKRTNHYLVIAKWTTESAWSQWFHSRERKQLMTVLAPFMQTDEKFTLLKQLAYHKYS
jgi:antibiotic biosynthesis monooxygenase (ABM) superfamily enzyme